MIFHLLTYFISFRVDNINTLEPAEGSAYIVGEPNSTVIAHLSQPAVLRCSAGGFPKPFVTWWRGDKILPLKDDRFEITRDYSLVFSRVDLYDLGTYACQAYNAIGRPVTISVTLRARGKVQPRTEEDYKYIQYIVTDPQPTSPPTYKPPPLTSTSVSTTRRPLPPPTRPPQTRPPQNVNFGKCSCLACCITLLYINLHDRA